MKGYGRRKIVLNIFWIILGAVLLVLSMTKTLNELYAGMGGGLIGVGIIQLIRGIRYNTDKEYRENYDTGTPRRWPSGASAPTWRGVH